MFKSEYYTHAILCGEDADTASNLVSNLGAKRNPCSHFTFFAAESRVYKTVYSRLQLINQAVQNGVSERG